MKINDTITHHTHRTSGFGGMRVNGFGRPTFCMAPEPSGAEGGGTGGTTPPNDQPGTAPAGDPPKVFNQEQVNQIAAKAREEGRAAALRSAPPQPQVPAAPKSQADELAAIKAQNEELSLRISFDKRAARMGLDDDASDELFQLYRLQKPEDPAAWFEKKKSIFKLTSATASGSTTTDPTKAAAAAASGPSISDKGSPAPGGAHDFEREVSENPFGFGGPSKERLIAQHGVEKARRMWMDAARRKAESIKVTI